jgi:predicted NAD/FAD-dependent oxidoreductase
MKSTKEISQVAVIGAGIAGLACAKELQLHGISVDVFEKSRGPSGRMSTRRTQDWSADHGAQYFTARNPRFIEEVQS